MMLGPLLIFDSLGSTNDYLKVNSDKFPSYTVVQAHYQTSGRGQFERRWESEQGKNLLLSILLKDVPLSKIESIRHYIIDSLTSWLDSYGLSGEFKAPNDIYVKHKKILGILVETRQLQDHFDYVIIGLGININQTSFTIDSATSLALLLNTQFDIEESRNRLFDIFNRGDWL